MAQQKKVMISIGTVLFLMILVLPMIMAPGTQQYVKIFLNPFYRESMTSATNYTYNITVNPPDKIASVSSAILSWNAQINGQSQVFTLWVNGQPCNTANYTVATAFSTTGNVQFYFDCTNRITKSGTYNVTIRSTVNTGAMIGWLDLTYMSNPSGITIHGTEYNSGDPGKVWLQLLDSDKTPIDNATCFMTMYTPNNLQLYSYLQMAQLSNGIYYFDFFAPEAVGVYPIVADCYYTTANKISYPSNYSIFTGTVVSGNVASLSANDGNRLKISEQTVDGPGLDFNITLKNITDISSETDMVIGLHGRWSGRSTDPVYIQIWNYTSGSWITMLNVIPNTGGMDVDTTNTFIISSGSNATSMGLVKNNNVTLRFVDANITDTDLEQLQIDSIWVNLVAQGSTGTWEQVKGSSEVHVNTNGGHLYNWNTLCDDHNAACALFSPSDTLTEGTINETLTINNIYKASLQDTIEYDTALGLDCTGVLSIIETYDNGATLDVTNQTIFDVGDKENCKMNIPVAFETTQQNMKVNIVSDNYPKWEVEWAKNVVDGMSNTITNYCNDIAIQEGVTYNLPINTSLLGTGLSPDVQYCYRAMDDLWYFNSNYDSSQSINTIGEYLSYLSESRFYYPLIYDHYNHVKSITGTDSGSLKVSGTEYSPGDPATIFLQVSNSNGLPVNTASCYLDIYYPLTNGTHPYTVQNAPMTYADNGANNGIYYYDLTAPSQLGVYMIGAKCSYPFNTIWYYPPTDQVNYPTEQQGTGTWQGSSVVLNAKDNLYERCDASVANPCVANYTYNLSVYGNITNISAINIYFAGEDDTNGKTLTMAYWNGTGFTNLANVLTFTGTGATAPTGYDEYLTNTIPLASIINNTIKIRTTATGTARYFPNWLSIAVMSTLGTIQDIKGSSEMHITNIPNATTTLVWNATNRSLTYYPDMTNYTFLATVVWNFSTRNLTYYQDVTNYSLMAQFVWNYISRNLTYTPDMTNYFTIQGMVWNATTRNLTYYDTNFSVNVTATVNNTAIAETVWSYINRNLTSTQDVTNYSNIQIYVWNATTRNLTYYQPTNLSDVPASIWNFTSRNLTYTPDMTNYSQIFIGVWNYTTRNLTYYDLGNNLSSSDIWNYVSRNLTFYPPASVDYATMQTYVWNATNRNLTYYNMTDVTDYNLIAQVVWNFSARNLTYYNLGNNLSASDVWNYVSRNLTFYEDVTNYTAITGNIWSYNNRTLTFYQVNNITSADIWGYFNRSLTENISQEVWLYQSRNLTYYPDMTNYTLGAQTIWSYVNRSLTEDIPFEVWTYSNRTTTNNQNISLDVWTYYNRSLNYYPDVTNYSLIWNYPSRNLTYYADATNYTLIPLSVWGYTGTIDSNILSQFTFAFWNYAGSITTITNQISSSVWNYVARYTHGEILD